MLILKGRVVFYFHFSLHRGEMICEVQGDAKGEVLGENTRK